MVRIDVNWSYLFFLCLMCWFDGPCWEYTHQYCIDCENLWNSRVLWNTCFDYSVNVVMFVCIRNFSVRIGVMFASKGIQRIDYYYRDLRVCRYVNYSVFQFYYCIFNVGCGIICWICCNFLKFIVFWVCVGLNANVVIWEKC